MYLAAEEVVRQKRVQQRAHERDPPRDRQPPEHDERRHRDQRERQDVEDVHHRRRVVGEETAEPEEDQVERVGARDRVVVEILPVRRSQVRVVEVPGVLHHRLDDGQVQDGVPGVVERDPEVGVPELQEHDRGDQGEHRGRCAEEQVAVAPHRPIDTSRSLAGPSGSSSRARRRCRRPRARRPVLSSKRPSSYHVRQFSGWRSTAWT